MTGRTDAPWAALPDSGLPPHDPQTAGETPIIILGGMTMYQSTTDIFIDSQDRDTVVFFAVAAKQAFADVDQLAAGHGDDTIVADDMADLMACINDFEISDLQLAA
ncbi:MAG: hypothetical protein ACKVH7_00135 [Alphaproteobacteria bacterium]